MRTFDKVCAQGDIHIMRIDGTLPKDAKEVEPKNGKLIVTHSETGHHHTMDATKAKLYELPDSIMDCLLVVENETTLDHNRPHDTHEAIRFKPGTYRVRRQREYTPEGWRRVED